MSSVSTSRNYRAFPLTWPEAIQIYCDQRKRLPKEKSSAPTGLVWDNNVVAVSLFWDTDMADVKSCNKALRLGAVKMMKERPWEQGYSS